MTDETFDTFLANVKALGVRTGDLVLYVETLRRYRDDLFAQVPYKVGDLVRLTTVGPEDERREPIPGCTGVDAPCRVVSIGYNKGVHRVGVTFENDAYTEMGTRYTRRLRPGSKYVWGFPASYVEAWPAGLPVPDPWAACTCRDEQDCGCGMWGFHVHAKGACPMHPLTSVSAVDPAPPRVRS